MALKRRCEWCSVQFEPVTSGERYHTERCRRAAHAERERQRRRDLCAAGICPLCKQDRKH